VRVATLVASVIRAWFVTTMSPQTASLLLVAQPLRAPDQLRRLVFAPCAYVMSGAVLDVSWSLYGGEFRWACLIRPYTAVVRQIHRIAL
jgi:hypothetical protein